MNNILLQQWIISILVLSVIFAKNNEISQENGFESAEEFPQSHQKKDLKTSVGTISAKYNISQNQGFLEVNKSGQIKQDNIRDHGKDSDVKVTSSSSTNLVDNNTKELLEWLKTQFGQNRVEDNDGHDHTARSYGDCYAYINASTLEALHALESDNRLRIMFTQKLKTSCSDPCMNYTQPAEYDSQPISQETCGSSFVININRNQIYEKMCIPQLHIMGNKPYFIRHKLYWCVNMEIPLRGRDISKRNVRKHDIDDDDKKQQEKLVLPHKGNRFHAEWSPLTNNCPSIDIQIDNRFFCETSKRDGIPEARNINEIDDRTQQLFLTEMIENIIDYDRVVNHYRFEHCNAFSFFFGHRRYLACAENLLAKKSLPLPMWSPEIQQKIPLVLQGIKFSPYACISSAYCTNGWFDIPFDRTEINVSLPVELMPMNICKQDFFTLHKKTMGYHRLVHNEIGGIFSSFDSPASPLFFAFHNYIDKKIFKTWEQCSNDNALFVKKHSS